MSKPSDAEKGASEGWEDLAEQAGEGSLGPNPELEEALRAAAAAVDVASRRPASSGAPGEVAEGAEAAPDAGELAEARERLLRLQADFENHRRRAQRERHEALEYGHQNLVKDLLSTVDNLDRAIEHARQRAGGDLESILHGVELVQRELLSTLVQHGVSEVDAHGKPFDPAVHEAMAQVPDASVPSNTVVEVMQKGYLLRDRLLRPARVVVSRVSEEAGDRSREAAD